MPFEENLFFCIISSKAKLSRFQGSLRSHQYAPCSRIYKIYKQNRIYKIYKQNSQHVQKTMEMKWRQIIAWTEIRKCSAHSLFHVSTKSRLFHFTICECVQRARALEWKFYFQPRDSGFDSRYWAVGVCGKIDLCASTCSLTTLLRVQLSAIIAPAYAAPRSTQPSVCESIRKG